MDKTLKGLVVLMGVMLCVWLVTLAVNANASDTHKRKTISAENTFSDPIKIPAGAYLNIAIEPISSPVMRIYLQCQYLDMEEDAGEWRNVDYWDITASSEDEINRPQTPEAETIKYRAGCPSGNYTSGSLAIRLGSWEGF